MLHSFKKKEIIMQKRILWISRNQPFAPQLVELRRLFGQNVVVQVAAIENAEDVVDAFLDGRYDDWVVLVPLATHQHIIATCERWGVTIPMRPKTEEVDSRDVADFEIRGKFFKLLGYERVTKITLQLEEPVHRPVRRVLYATQHLLHPATAEDIRVFCGEEVEISHDTRLARDGREVASRMQQIGADELILVAPLSIFDQLTRMGICPLWVEMRQVGARAWEYVRLWRVTGLSIETTQV